MKIKDRQTLTRKWLDSQIEAYKLSKLTLPEEFGNIKNIEWYAENEIHINGVKEISSILGIDYEIAPHSKDYDQISFFYKNFRFFQLIDREDIKF